MKTLPNITAGEILKEEFMKPLGLSQYALAKELAVSPMRISEIVRFKRAITSDTALPLLLYFCSTPSSFLRIQTESSLPTAPRAPVKQLSPPLHPPP